MNFYGYDFVNKHQDSRFTQEDVATINQILGEGNWNWYYHPCHPVYTRNFHVVIKTFEAIKPRTKTLLDLMLTEMTPR